MLEGDEFIKRVVPSLSRLFASSDRNLRRNLLESIDTYGQHLTTVSAWGRGGEYSARVCLASQWCITFLGLVAAMLQPRHVYIASVL